MARDPDAVDKLVQKVQRRGYSTSDREYLTNTRAIAVPIMLGERVMGCVNVMVLAEVMSLNQAGKTFSAPLHALAALISEKLQHQPKVT
jgi:IclR family mhp operon transcriptional activator